MSAAPHARGAPVGSSVFAALRCSDACPCLRRILSVFIVVAQRQIQGPREDRKAIHLLLPRRS
jgi:hypothetical protein